MENPNDIVTPPVSSEPKRNKRKLIILIVAILVLIASGVSAYLFLKPSIPAHAPSPKTPVSAQKTTKRVVYTVKNGSEADGNRQFLKYEVWFADAGSKPTSLGIYGEAGKYFYPNETLLSQDGKTVFLKYDNSIESIDIANKKVTVTYTTSTDRRITSFIQSQSGKELLVATSASPIDPGKATVALDRVNLADSNKITNEYSAQRSDISLRAWRSDDVIVFSDIMYSEFTRYGTYNLKTKAISNTGDGKHNVQRLTVSPAGETIGIPAGTVDDVCDKFSGSSINKFTLLDPLTEANIANIASDNIISNVEIGQNNKAIVTTLPLINDDSKCETSDSQTPSYSVYDITTKKLHNKASYQEAYKEVFSDRPFVETSLKNKVCTLTIESQQALTKECTGEPEYIIIGAVTIKR